MDLKPTDTRSLISINLLNLSVFSVNQNPPIPSFFDRFSDKRIVLKCQKDRLSLALSLGGTRDKSKIIIAYLVTEKGDVLVAESKGNPTFLAGKGMDAGFMFLSFQFAQLTDTKCGNIFRKTDQSKLIVTLRRNFRTLQQQNKLQVIENEFDSYDVSLGVQFILKHGESLDAYHKEFMNEEIEALWVPELSELSAPSQKKKAESVIQPSKPKPAKELPEQPAEQKVGQRPKQPPKPTPISTPAPVTPAASAVRSQKRKKRPIDFHKWITERLRQRADSVEGDALSLNWNKENTGHILVGEGNITRTEDGAKFDGSNNRDNYRIYFDDFPSYALKDSRKIFLKILNVSRSGAGISIQVPAERDVKPFNLGDELFLCVAMVKKTDHEIFCEVVRERRTVAKNNRILYWFGVQFAWGGRSEPPEEFIRSVHLTQQFLAAMRFLSQDKKPPLRR